MQHEISEEDFFSKKQLKKPNQKQHVNEAAYSRKKI